MGLLKTEERRELGHNAGVYVCTFCSANLATEGLVKHMDLILLRNQQLCIHLAIKFDSSMLSVNKIIIIPQNAHQLWILGEEFELLECIITGTINTKWKSYERMNIT